MCCSFRRGGGAGIVVFPRPNPQTVPCGRGTSKRGERTCWRLNWWLLFRGTSQSPRECRDSSKVWIDKPERHSRNTALSSAFLAHLANPPRPRPPDSRFQPPPPAEGRSPPL